MGDNEYEEYEDYDEEYRDLMIDQFKNEGLECKKGLRFWVDNEMKENEKRMMKYIAEKGKNVVDVASDNHSSFCCSTSSEAKLSPDSALLTWRSPSTGYEAPLPFLWGRHPTKRRTAGRNDYCAVPYDQDRTNKCQKIIKGKNVVDVTADEETSADGEQNHCSSSSETNWSSGAYLLMEFSVRRTYSTYYNDSVPPPNLGHHTTITTTKETTFMEIKTRTTAITDNMGQVQRRKKRQYIEIRAEEKHQQPKEKRKKKKAKTERKSQSHIPPPPPPGGIPMNLQLAITEVGGTTPVWLTEKRKLTVTDTNRKEGRLFIPTCGGHVLEQYLTAEEKEKLLNPTDDSKGLKVMVVDTSGEQFDLDLRIWKSLNQYVFARNWNHMVKKLKMQPGSDTVQIWCFRLPAERGSKLCFATNIERGHSNTLEDILEAEPV